MSECKYCGDGFVPKRMTRQVYCSLECAREANLQNSKQRNELMKKIKKLVEAEQ